MKNLMKISQALLLSTLMAAIAKADCNTVASIYYNANDIVGNRCIDTLPKGSTISLPVDLDIPAGATSIGLNIDCTLQFDQSNYNRHLHGTIKVTSTTTENLGDDGSNGEFGTTLLHGNYIYNGKEEASMVLACESDPIYIIRKDIELVGGKMSISSTQDF